jgi:hypothetical protein
MLKAIWLCIRRVFSTVTGAIGALSSLIGSLSEWLGHQIVVPGWAWLAFGSVLLFATACRIEMELMREKDKNLKPQPTLKLAQVITRITGFVSVMPLSAEQSGKAAATGDALDEIGEKANLGLLNVFGRTGRVLLQHQRSSPLGLIPQDHWERYGIDYLELLTDERGITKGMISASDNIGFTDLWFDAEQVDAIWPAKKRPKFVWRMPIVRASSS